MTSLTALINDFDHCITASAIDSVAAIERSFSLAQSRNNEQLAIKALAMALVTAEHRRRALEAQQSAKLSS